MAIATSGKSSNSNQQSQKWQQSTSYSKSGTYNWQQQKQQQQAVMEKLWQQPVVKTLQQSTGRGKLQ